MLLARRGLHTASSAARMQRNINCLASASARLAVVGDVHNQWSARDAAALQALNADIALFVGDIGNENVELVKQIAAIDMPKAVILGNHDAWYTMTARPRSKSRSPPPTSAGAHNGSQQTEAAEPRGRVEQQLDALADAHVGYGHMLVPNTDISLVGARPFSKGGKSFRTIRDFMGRLYGVHDMDESAQRIMDVINSQVPESNTLILMGHNGPAGLGDQRHNICGVDWVKESGDHGDPDLQSVLQQLKDAGRGVALVVFGHMHHTLKGGDKRQMVHIDESTGTVYLNAATVPRVRTVPQLGGHLHPVSRHHFLVIDITDGQVHSAADVWVQVTQLPHLTEQPACSTSNSDNRTPEVQLDTEAASTANAPSSSSNLQSSAAATLLQYVGNSTAQETTQVVLDWQQQMFDGFAVQVIQVSDVLRTVAGSSTGQGHGIGCIEYWDAFSAVWKKADLRFVPAVAEQVTMATDNS